MFSDNRLELRQAYFAAWQAIENNIPVASLDPLQQQLVAIIQQHPEYHYIFKDKENTLDKDFTPEMGEANPFMHFSLHMAIHEQISTDRPQGITDIYRQLVIRKGDAHVVDHMMMEILADTMWQMLNQGVEIDERAYLARLQQLS